MGDRWSLRRLATLGCVLAVWAAGTPASEAGVCKLEGIWAAKTAFSSTTWTIEKDGTASESGGGNAKGKATLEKGSLTITWETAKSDGYAGVYTWKLEPDCSGKGKLKFTKVAEGDTRIKDDHDTTVTGTAVTQGEPIRPRRSPIVISVGIETGKFDPEELVTRDGDTLDICNHKPTKDSLFSFSSHNKFGGKTSKNGVHLDPEQCAKIKLRNPTKKYINVLIKSDMVSGEELRIVVFPAK